MRGRLRRVLPAILACVIACAEEPAPPRGPAATPRHLVLISVDTLKADVIDRALRTDGALPNLRDLAERSVIFSHAYSTAPWTLPATASLLTGLYPDRHGATARGMRIDPAAQTLAGRLSEAGFETVGFSGGAFADARYGFARGFDRYDDQAADATDASGSPAFPLPRDGRPGELDELFLFDRALAWLEAAPTDERLFLFLQTYLVHDYYRVHSWVQSFSPRRFLTREYYLACVSGLRECSVEDWSNLAALYDAEVAALDRGLGELIDALRARGLFDETLIVFVSDHGEGFDPGRKRTHHGGRLHADLIRVPMLFAGPGLSPETLAAPASLVDVVPTVLDLLEVPRRLDGARLDGHSLAGLMRGESAPPSRLLHASDYFYEWQEGQRVAVHPPRSEPVSRALIRGPIWYIQSPEGEELYDMRSDPEQRKDLARRHPLAQSLRLRAAARARDFRAPAHPFEEDAVLREQLEALGYVEDRDGR